jgi:hypothetical protein
MNGEVVARLLTQSTGRTCPYIVVNGQLRQVNCSKSAVIMIGQFVARLLTQ